MKALWVIVAAFWLTAALPTRAHEALPATLHVSEATPGLFAVLWRVPVVQQGGMPAIFPLFPDACIEHGPVKLESAPNATTLRWRIDCGPDGLSRGHIRISGLGSTVRDVLVRIDFADRSVTEVLRPAKADLDLSTVGGPPKLAAYFPLGVEHILFGIDHLLFVLGLVLIVGSTGRLVATVTAFTLAHSITLALAALGVVDVPTQPTEATIALSIMFLAYELVRLQQGEPGITARYPWFIAFAFGLLHGLGFAGALAEVGLPADGIRSALFLFNLGVEAGQLAFIAVVLLALAVIPRLQLSWPGWTRAIPAYAIGSIAGFWLIDRL